MLIWEEHEVKELFKSFQTRAWTPRIIKSYENEWCALVAVWKNSRSFWWSLIRKRIVTRLIAVRFRQKLASRCKEQRWTTSNAELMIPTRSDDNSELSVSTVIFSIIWGNFRLFHHMILVCQKTAPLSPLTILSETASFLPLLEGRRYVVKLYNRHLDPPVAVYTMVYVN